MRTVIFEIRDKATCIPAMATIFGPEAVSITYYEKALLAHVGYDDSNDYVLLTSLSTLRSEHDAYTWGDRTMSTVHKWLEVNIDKIVDGLLVDVEYILGETDKPKESDVL